jgi:hypothetical protein
MRKFKLVWVSILLGVSAVLFYFFIPLSAERVFPATEDIKRVYIGHSRVISGGEILHDEELPVEDVEQIKTFLNMLNNVEYSRILKRDILNPYRFHTFTIIYDETNNYMIQVNENGLLSVYDNRKKQYRVIKGDGKKLFKQLDQYVQIQRKK